MFGPNGSNGLVIVWPQSSPDAVMISGGAGDPLTVLRLALRRSDPVPSPDQICPLQEDADERRDCHVLVPRQAQKLKEQLDASGVGTTVLVPILEAGIMNAVPVPKKSPAQTPKERAENARLRAKANREKKALAAGRSVGQRGRPLGSKSKSRKI